MSAKSRGTEMRSNAIDTADGKTYTLSPREFAVKYSPAYGEDWDNAQTILLSSMTERRTVERLRSELRLHGSFREPIIVYSDTERVANGMHRTVAHLLEDSPELRFRLAEEGEQLNPLDSFWSVEIQLSDPTMESTELVWDAIRSFPLPSGAWVENVAGSACNNTVYGTLQTSDTELSSDNLEEVLRSELALIPIPILRITVEQEDWLSTIHTE